MKDVDKYGLFVDSVWFSSKSKTKKLTARDHSIMNLGLPGEVGEVLELLKKNIRDGGKLDKEALKKELGDVAYYWARICSAHGFKPSEVLKANKAKLQGRVKRQTLRGSGNNR
jgi:NTP pyrophosphatase (non-canonical NTP hydrolase)